MSKRKRPASAARRYQPRTSLCEECDPQHKNLLIVGTNFHNEKLKQCSENEQVDGILNLPRALSSSGQPDRIVLVLPTIDWVPEPQILDFITNILGNVSLFVSGHGSNNVLMKHCRSLGARCFRLDNLLPVINQIEVQNSLPKSQEDEAAKALLDLYNARWLTNIDITTDQRPPNLHKQFEQLTNELCKRQKHYNQVIQLHKTSSKLFK